jgi:membrane protease YdiL (CAAX protease family)
MKKYFWNPDENRLRAGWRIVMYLIIQISLSLIFNQFIKQILGGYPKDITMKIVMRGIVVIIIVPIAVWTARKFFDRRSFISLGLRFDGVAVKDMILGFLLSGVMVAGVFFTLLATGILEMEVIDWTGSSLTPIVGILLWFFGIGAAVGWSEEIAFRGYLLQNLRDGIGLRWAVIISCIFYGVIHMPNPNSTLLSGVLIAAIGFLRIYGWLSSSQLWLSMGMHAGWNFFQGPIFGFHVSGLDIETLIQHSVKGPAWITGGVFGPEAGVVVLPVVILGLAVMYLWTKKRKDTPWVEYKQMKYGH